MKEKIRTLLTIGDTKYDCNNNSGDKVDDQDAHDDKNGKTMD